MEYKIIILIIILNSYTVNMILLIILYGLFKLICILLSQCLKDWICCGHWLKEDNVVLYLKMLKKNAILHYGSINGSIMSVKMFLCMMWKICTVIILLNS